MSSLIERKKTKYLKIKYNPIIILYYKDIYIIKGAYKARLIFIKGLNLAPYYLDLRGPI